MATYTLIGRPQRSRGYLVACRATTPATSSIMQWQACSAFNDARPDYEAPMDARRGQHLRVSPSRPTTAPTWSYQDCDGDGRPTKSENSGRCPVRRTVDEYMETDMVDCGYLTSTDGHGCPHVVSITEGDVAPVPGRASVNGMLHLQELARLRICRATRRRPRTTATT